MKLYPNWKTLIKKAWSLRFMAVAGLLSGCEVALPFMSEYVPQGLRGWFAGLALVLTAAAFWARLVAQKAIDD
jgi:hypothetical protein